MEPLHKNVSFPLRISSVNVTTFPEEILNGKITFCVVNAHLGFALQ